MGNTTICKTGNQVVDSVAEMNITGNVIPEAWYKTIVKENGRVNVNSLLILSEVVYWYRPMEVRDEASNKTIYKKKFRDDQFVQLSYEKLCDKFNLSPKQVRESLKLLESHGIIKRHLRDISTEMGKLHNVLFIELIPEGLKNATFPDGTSNNDNKSDPNGKAILPKKEICHSQSEKTYTEEPSKNSSENTTASHVDEATIDEAVKLYKALGLPRKDAIEILTVASGDISRCQKALNLLNQQAQPIRNVTGWLIKAVKEDFEAIQKKPSSRPNSFTCIQQHEYDFDTLERRLLQT